MHEVIFSDFTKSSKEQLIMINIIYIKHNIYLSLLLFMMNSLKYIFETVHHKEQQMFHFFNFLFRLFKSSCPTIYIQLYAT